MSDAAVGDAAEGDNLDPEGNTGAAPGSEAEGQAGDAGSKDQPSESSTENQDQDSAQARIDEITGKYRSTERDRDYWKERAMAAEDLIPKPQPEVKLDKSLKDFDGDEAAFANYVATETSKAYELTLEQQAEKTASRETSHEFLERENKYAVDLPDYDKVTRSPDLRISGDMKDYIMAAGDDGPGLLYYLGKNPSLAAEISELPPMQAAHRLKNLQATDLAKPTPSKTETPAPGRRLRGTEHATSIDPGSPDSDKLSTEEWWKRETAKELKRREAGTR